MSEQIRRYELCVDNCECGDAKAVSYSTPDGPWCQWSDVAPLLERLARAEAEADAWRTFDDADCTDNAKIVAAAEALLAARAARDAGGKA